jgi:hypothetical protein
MGELRLSLVDRAISLLFRGGGAAKEQIHSHLDTTLCQMHPNGFAIDHQLDDMAAKSPFRRALLCEIKEEVLPPPHRPRPNILL